MRAVGRRRLPLAWFRVEEYLPRLTGEWADALPDLDDPATAGVLLEMVRAAWGGGVEVHIHYAVTIRLFPASHGRVPYLPGPLCLPGDTLGHAAALALMAVWGPA